MLISLLGICAVANAVTPPPGRESIAFIGVNVVPMTGEFVLERQTVVVSDQVIVAMGREDMVRVPRRAIVVPGHGKYLMPGLAEMHAHVPSGEKSRTYRDDVLFLYVANGVTFARGMLGDAEHLTLQAALAAHQILGPRLYTSGPSLNGQSVKSAEQGVALVREQKQAGYDFVKLHPGLSRDAFLAIARAAHESRMPFDGHVSQDVGLSLTFENQQATVDHLDGYVLAVSSAAGDLTNNPDNVGLAMKFEAREFRKLYAVRELLARGSYPPRSFPRT